MSNHQLIDGSKASPHGSGAVVSSVGGEGVTRRATLKGFAVLAAADKLTDGGFAEVTRQGVPERERYVLPPGAGDAEKFRAKCVACGLCIAECPEKIIRASTDLKRFGQPELDFRNGYCLFSCVRCSKACPSKALEPLQAEMKPNVHVGAAVWKQDLCVRTTEGDQCTACVRKCPVQAIHLVKGFPVVDRERCIGCGACEHVCPARPLPAIFVQGFERQRIVRPLSENDLVAEMRALLDGGRTIVVAKDGVIVRSDDARGLAPLVKLYDEGVLAGTVLADRVVGRAAAAVYALGKVRRVVTPLAAEGAAAICERAGVAFYAEKTVKTIMNREQTGMCPMENAVKDLDDPEKMLSAVRTTIERMKKK